MREPALAIPGYEFIRKLGEGTSGEVHSPGARPMAANALSR